MDSFPGSVIAEFPHEISALADGKPWLALSDAHLGCHEGDFQDELVALLDSVEGKIDRLVILGDLFDFWFGYRQVFFSRFLPVISALKRLVSSGCRISYLIGNHDFHIGPVFSDYLEADIHTAPWIVRLEPFNFLFRHGDGLNPNDSAYGTALKILRNPITLRLMSLVHPDWAWPIASFCSRTSRKRKKENVEKSRNIALGYFRESRAEGCDIVVLAHTHDPMIVDLTDENGPAALVNTGDWLRLFTFLLIGRSGLQIRQVPLSDFGG